MISCRRVDMILGLTGGIASGKSTASEILKRLGAYIVDADKISHEVANSVEVVEKVRKTFGEEVVLEGRLNRIKLREIIFEDNRKRDLLNNIMHPIIIEKIQEEIELNKKEELIVLDVPLLFEVKLEKLCDKTLVIWIEKGLQIERVIKRDKTTKEIAEKILESQMKLSEKIKRSDYNIENNGTKFDLEEKLKELNIEIKQ
jgi:dephospho-CoA kinase